MESKLGTIVRGDERIYITHLPGFKNPCLCVGNGNVMQKIASFGSEECAEGFYKLLLDWLGIEKREQ